MEKAEAIWQEILARGDCLDLKHLAITGRDLMALGAKPGKELGTLLGQCLETVLEDPSRNTRDALLLQCKEAGKCPQNG